MFKYFEFKRWQYLCIGFTWILMVSPWYGDCVQFILIIFFNIELSEFIYFLVTFPIVAIALFLWLIAITNLLATRKRKLILGLCFILVTIFEIIYFILLLTNTTLIGTLINPFTVEMSLFVQIFILIFMVLFLGSGLIFSRDALKSDDKELKLKGKLLTIAFILYTLGAFLEVFLPISEFTVVITRINLVLSSILFYLGYVLPDWIKNMFLKEV